MGGGPLLCTDGPYLLICILIINFYFYYYYYYRISFTVAQKDVFLKGCTIFGHLKLHDYFVIDLDTDIFVAHTQHMIQEIRVNE